ncbi:hypothetical protein DSM106972_071480 [Dulcicalothrix desertica PCC 7102]|uniref:Uncharacterized protein n=1 Tax=Dulcicalothrix desertica PCC 7102 TaxID=232991 RepID=A0A3S1AXA5_9CYAN|nr:hypothetical protein DSM106972_071480 [Dulcicalothrix desertica PCC 7102]
MRARFGYKVAGTHQIMTHVNLYRFIRNCIGVLRLNTIILCELCASVVKKNYYHGDAERTE